MSEVAEFGEDAPPVFGQTLGSTADTCDSPVPNDVQQAGMVDGVGSAPQQLGSAAPSTNEPVGPRPPTRAERLQVATALLRHRHVLPRWLLNGAVDGAVGGLLGGREWGFVGAVVGLTVGGVIGRGTVSNPFEAMHESDRKISWSSLIGTGALELLAVGAGIAGEEYDNDTLRALALLGLFFGTLIDAAAAIAITCKRMERA